MSTPVRRRRMLAVLVALAALFLVCPAALADGGSAPAALFAAPWSLLPPVVAILLALLTREVYSALFTGVLVGALMVAGGNLERTLTAVVSDGLIASLADGGNVGILIFLVVLGVLVSVLNRAGGSAAYGRWASKRIRSRRGAMGSTALLGVLIFVDDYFNCLTVGNVMRPVTDGHNVSRAKLAYLVDATAAPVCMIAPISSWAAAVAAVSDGDGLGMFIRAIPYNFYSLLTIAMVFLLILLDLDFGPMRRNEENAKRGDLFSGALPDMESNAPEAGTRGRVIDLVLPVLILIVCCVLGMVYTGGAFSGVDLITAFSECDASVGLAMGSLVALLLTFVYCMARRVLSFQDFMRAIPEGFRAMVPAILILTFAWTLSAMTGLLGADQFVAAVVKGTAGRLNAFLPAIIFLIALGLSFATGTSWGTFGILLPIVVGVLAPGTELAIISVSACLAGAVCGDHCSPISDTTIMSSAGAQCDHVSHVSTQLPYALFAAGLSFLLYLLAGFVQSAWIVLPIGLAVLTGALLLIRGAQRKKAA